MPSCRHLFCCAVVGLMMEGLSALSALGQMQPLPPMNAPPPQQMPASGMPGMPAANPGPTIMGSDYGTAGSVPMLGAPAVATPYPSTSGPAIAPAGAAMPEGGMGGVDPGPISTPSGDPATMNAAPPFDPNAYSSLAPNGYIDRSLVSQASWQWQLLPTGLMYKSYLAGNREPRWEAKSCMIAIWVGCGTRRSAVESVFCDTARKTNSGRKVGSWTSKEPRFRGSISSTTKTWSIAIFAEGSFRPHGKGRSRPSSDSTTSVPTSATSYDPVSEHPQYEDQLCAGIVGGGHGDLFESESAAVFGERVGPFKRTAARCLGSFSLGSISRRPNRRASREHRSLR